MKSIKFFYLILCFLFMLLGGCTKKENQIHLLLDWWPNPNHIPIFVGKKLGFFSKNGIQLEILKLADPPECIPYILSERADVGVYYMPNALKAASKNDQIQVVATLINQPLRCFLFREDSAISSPCDLNQKVLGGNPEGLFTAFVQNLSSHSKISFKEIKKIQIDPITALMTQMVDVVGSAFCNIEPYQLKVLGLPTHFFKISDFDIPSYDELVIISKKSFLEKHKGFSQSFQNSLQESIDFCKKNPEIAFQIYLQERSDKNEKKAEWEKESWNSTCSLFSNEQKIDQKKLENFYHWMKDSHLIEGEVDLSHFLEPHLEK